MLLFKAGSAMPEKSLGGVLRENWSAAAASRLQQIEDRKKSGVPLDDGNGPLTELGAYPYMDALDNVSIVIRTLPLSSIRESQMRLADLLPHQDSSQDQRQKAVTTAMKYKRGFVLEALVSISGLETSEGPFVFDGSESALALLEDNGLIDHVFNAAHYLHELTGDERKNCGALQQQTLSTSTVTPVPSPCEGSEGAMAEAECSTTLGPNSRQGPAPGESSTGIPGSAVQSSSTVPPEMLG